ncbi:MAG TPA: BTAD domain-containing putative transcriptional regulator [Solirubrobacteraceae bacterium]|nr:BTAD domain-containing putative transcriptional regulator [Solirubrobacteraceae bacterium]
MIDPLEIRLLGPFEVLVHGRPISVKGGRRHGLLALLALRCGRVVAMDALIEALWGEVLPAAPRNAVQHHVARLRAVLGPESILGFPDGYRLNDASVDALRFEGLLGEARVALREGDARAGADAIRSALGLWRGTALQGLTDTAWFSAEALRLEALRMDALEEQFEAALALGDHREIVSELRAALEEDPFRERLWGQLMLALYRSGRQADALETFREARRVLAEELGLEPVPELRRLQEAILEHDPAIGAVPAAPRRGNLPAPSTSFVDREHELGQIVDLLREHRLVTLTGPPGVGKSRLALEVVRSLESQTQDGGWLVDLGRAGGAADVVRVVAGAVDARGADPLARVIARLRDADAVVLLDACEHVTEEAGRVASRMLRECGGLRVLATSREALHVVGEVRVSVAPLAVPDPESADGAGCAAVQLFAVRAQAARPGFELTAETVPIVAEISRQVDGLPLAIELAAARVSHVGLGELGSLVARRLAHLGDRRSAQVGRAGLRTLVEWSYDLVHGDEKTLLHQLAVHRGGASLASMVAVGACDGLDETTVSYLLGRLVDKSIVSVSFPDDNARYDLLDSVRDYVLEHLAVTGGLAAAQRAHAEYFATLADAGRRELRGGDWQAWVRRLALENDNLWAALTHARSAPDPAIAIRLGAALGWYFALAGRVSEGRQFLELALAAAAEDAPVNLRIELLGALCFLATEELDLDAALDAGERGLALTRAAPASSESVLLQATLSLALAYAGDHERAAVLAEDACAAGEAAGGHWDVAMASLLRAMSAVRAGELSTAAAMAAQTYRRSEAIGFDAFQVPAKLLEASVAKRLGDREGAVDAYAEALELARLAGLADHAALALAGLGSAALASEDLRHAEELFRRSLAAAEAARAPWVAAHARVNLGRVLAAAGDAETAEKLYRNVLEWSQTSRPRQARESLNVALAGNPAAAALLGLAELAEARGDAAAAQELRAHTGLSIA